MGDDLLLFALRAGIEGHGFFDRLVVPVVENTAHEHELKDRLAQAIQDYPDTKAVLVRRHGVYIWGKDWVQVLWLGVGILHRFVFVCCSFVCASMYPSPSIWMFSFVCSCCVVSVSG